MRRGLKPLVFMLCLAPALWLSWQAFQGGLGSNPVERLTHFTGDWALRMLLVTLAVTPVRRLTRWHEVIAFRRMLGLFAFFYALLHFSVYMVFDHFFDFGAILRDVIKHPYIMLGMLAFVLMIPLAITSTQYMMRRMGRRWRQLHRLIYLIAFLGVLHYLWLVKADISQPLIYGLILVVLLMLRRDHRRVR